MNSEEKRLVKLDIAHITAGCPAAGAAVLRHLVPELIHYGDRFKLQDGGCIFWPVCRGTSSN